MPVSASEKNKSESALLSRDALRGIAAAFCVALAIVWAVSWLSPGIGLQFKDGAYLVAGRALAEGHGYITANAPRPIAETGFPPLFPAALAVWSLLSLSAVWLKALPVACSVAWLWLTWKLLRKMGASDAGAALIVGLVAACPGVIAYATNLFPTSLFALLLTLSLVLLLEGFPALAGVSAGLATLTSLAGLPLLAACMITLVVRGRFRDSIRFTAPAILLVAPWFAFALVHGAYDPGSGINTYTASNLFTALEPGDKCIVFLRNLRLLFQSPFAALSGMENPIAAGITALLVIVCVIRKRHLLPDLFVLLYAGMLLLWIGPPAVFIPPILPLFFWMLWRAADLRRWREPVAALVILAAILPFWQDFRRIPETRRTGEFTRNDPPAESWTDLTRFFSEIKRNTAPQAVVAANLAPLFYFETGRKTIRGFDPGGYDLYYSARPYAVPPDQLSLELLLNCVNYFALTPGDVTPSGAPLHTAIEALERGRMVERVPIPGLPAGYELLRVVRHTP